MKKTILILSLLVSFIYADTYSEGFKFFIKAKKELRKGNITKANSLFLKAKSDFQKTSHNALSLLKLSVLYCNGWGVKKNKSQAKSYLKQATAIIPNINTFDKCVKQLKENK